jgi:SAM-dependent methyltransferase
LARRAAVERVYAVDACEAIVRELMPAVVPFAAGAAADKVVGCVGEFDRLGVPDASADFAFDFFSLHHSADLGRTCRELARILKPGGFVLCFDKARDDRLVDAQVQALLDREYSRDFKRLMGKDPDVRWTRRMNGEFEYRLREWRAAFLGNGFTAFEHHQVARIRSASAFVRAGKRLFSLLPPRLQGRLMDLLPLKPQNDLSPKGRVYTDLLERFPKEISLMIAWK